MTVYANGTHFFARSDGTPPTGFTTPSDSNDGLCPIGFGLSGATFTAIGKTLTSTGAFTNYTHSAGDVIGITGGTGVTVGVYTIASKTNNDTIVLDDAIAGVGNPTDVSSGNGPLATFGKPMTLTTSPSWVHLCGSASFTETALVTIGNIGDGPAQARIVSWGALRSGIEDGTVGTVVFNHTADGMNFTASNARDHIHFRNIIFDGNSQAVDCIDVTSTRYHAQTYWFNCEMRNFTGYVMGASSPMWCMSDCYLHDCNNGSHGGQGFREAGTIYEGMTARGVTNAGSDGPQAFNCMYINNGTHGFHMSGSSWYTGSFLYSCLIGENGGDGVEKVGASPGSFVNCIFFQNGGYGINNSGSKFGYATRNNCFYNNISGHVNASDIANDTIAERDLDEAGSHSVFADPLLKGVSGGNVTNATLQGGSPCIDAGPNPDASFTTYLEIGPHQRA